MCVVDTTRMNFSMIWPPYLELLSAFLEGFFCISRRVSKRKQFSCISERLSKRKHFSCISERLFSCISRRRNSFRLHTLSPFDFYSFLPFPINPLHSSNTILAVFLALVAFVVAQNGQLSAEIQEMQDAASKSQQELSAASSMVRDMSNSAGDNVNFVNQHSMLADPAPGDCSSYN